MSLSPTATTSNSSDVPSKRRRTDSIVPMQGMTQSSAEGSAHPQPPAHIPKRGARACTACRKGKNRCEGEVSSLDGPLRYRAAINSLARPPAPARHGFGQAPCRRCQLSGTPCVFEKPEKKIVQPVSGASVEYVHIEKFSSSLLQSSKQAPVASRGPVFGILQSVYRQRDSQLSWSLS